MYAQSSLLSAFALLVLAALIIFGGIMLFLSRPEPATITIHPPVPTATEAPTATPSPILVYVTGAVRNPETTYRLPYASRVSDAIEAAGGFTEMADRSLVNLAAVLRDGDQVHSPSADSAAPELPTPPGGAMVWVNSATAEELQTLPGVGPALAERILQYREQTGSFTVLADLDNVPGVGEATLEKWRDLVAFD